MFINIEHEGYVNEMLVVNGNTVRGIHILPVFEWNKLEKTQIEAYSTQIGS